MISIDLFIIQDKLQQMIKLGHKTQISKNKQETFIVFTSKKFSSEI